MLKRLIVPEMLVTVGASQLPPLSPSVLGYRREDNSSFYLYFGLFEPCSCIEHTKVHSCYIHLYSIHVLRSTFKVRKGLGKEAGRCTHSFLNHSETPGLSRPDGCLNG